jgi:hypothetical protein
MGARAGFVGPKIEKPPLPMKGEAVACSSFLSEVSPCNLSEVAKASRLGNTTCGQAKNHQQRCSLARRWARFERKIADRNVDICDVDVRVEHADVNRLRLRCVLICTDPILKAPRERRGIETD